MFSMNESIDTSEQYLNSNLTDMGKNSKDERVDVIIVLMDI